MKNDLSLYLDVRSQMRTGDLLQWHSNSVLGKMIRTKTHKDRPKYEVENDINVNHSSLVICLKEVESGDLRIHTNEAMEKGTVPAFLSVRLQQFDGHVWWYPLNDEIEGIFNVDRIKIGRNAFEYLGVGYDYWAIAKKLVNIKTRIDIRKLFCNEYCSVCYGVRTGSVARSPNAMPRLHIHKTPTMIL